VPHASRARNAISTKVPGRFVLTSSATSAPPFVSAPGPRLLGNSKVLTNFIKKLSSVRNEISVSRVPETQVLTRAHDFVTMTTIAPGLKKYVEREALADAPPARPGSKVHVHFTVTVRSKDEIVDSSRGEFTTNVGGITVRKCGVPLALTLPSDAPRIRTTEAQSAPRVGGERAGGNEPSTGAHDTANGATFPESRRDDFLSEVAEKKGSGSGRELLKNRDRDEEEKETIGFQTVIGFTLSVLSMRLGERASFRVPSALAYGAKGKGKVGPNEDLDFDLELVGVDGEYFPARKKDTETSSKKELDRTSRPIS